MDLNQPLEFTPSSTPPAQLHNFNPLPPLFLPSPYHQTTLQESGEARQCHLMELQKQILELFWNHRLLEIHSITEFKGQHQLPLARIKKIMKTDEDVKMISAETPVLFSKACELFILELTLRAWLQTEDSNRRILQRCDIAKAIRHDELLDFLVDVIPLDDPKLLLKTWTRYVSCRGCSFKHIEDSCSQEEEAAKYPEETESCSAIQLHFPVMNVNE